MLGSPQYAAARLNFSQGFQGVASFAGPLIASRWFFLGKNATTLDTVQWSLLFPHYLHGASDRHTLQGLSRCCRPWNCTQHHVLVRESSVRMLQYSNLYPSFCHLPEITEEALTEEIQDIKDVDEPFYKQYRCIFGWVAQTCYVYVASLFPDGHRLTPNQRGASWGCLLRGQLLDCFQPESEPLSVEGEHHVFALPGYFYSRTVRSPFLIP